MPSYITHLYILLYDTILHLYIYTCYIINLIFPQYIDIKYTYQSTTYGVHRTHFDTDSYDMLVDNCCSQSITNCLEDFIAPPKKSSMKIKGLTGSTSSTLVGTVRWKILDDQNKIHSIILPNTYYSPMAETRLFSPQHWAQSTNKGRETKCITYHDAIILEWNNGKYKKTIPLTPDSRNVGLMTSPVGHRQYLRACSAITKDNPDIIFPRTISMEDTNIITDDELDSEEDNGTTITGNGSRTSKATKNNNNEASNEDEATHPDSQEQDPQEQQQKEAAHQEEQEDDTPEEEQINLIKHHPVQTTFESQMLDIRNDHPTFEDEVQEYMHWHYKLNHASPTVMQKMAEQKMLPRGITKIIKRFQKQGKRAPMCNDCYCASAARTPWRRKPSNQERTMIDKRKDMKPGDIVSVDQLESSTPGFMGQITGTLTRQRLVGSTVFVDQASDMTYIYHHTSLSSEETVRAKEAFESFALSHGVRIKQYHADNGRFKDKAFMQSIQDNKQTISFAGVGAHHQNGIAEKRIGDLQRKATTLILHAQRRWPDAISTHLWPYALRAAVDSRNYAPTNKDDKCPISRFCATRRTPAISNQHHFGCPVYVLKKEIQDGRKAKKWNDRTRIGINLGYSPRHAYSVSLILNLETGLVSPQYHCSYDDLFETTTGTQARSIPKSMWQYKAGFGKEIKGRIAEPSDEEENSENEDIEENEEGEMKEEQQSEPELNNEEEEEKDQYRTRSGRQSRKPERLEYVSFESILEPYDYDDMNKWCEQDLIAYKASSDPDTMYYHQAMREPDKEKFQEAIQKECNDHLKETNLSLILKDELPKNATLLSSVWQMKRKRKPSTGEITKYKARLNVDGSQQIKGIHYEETYAPVVGWSTIRFFMTLAVLNKWHTRQLDFVLAYTQADIERDLYMKLPPGFTVDGKIMSEEDRKKYVLKLNKNLYGQKQAGRVWYLHLRKNLIKMGFKPSEHDECVYYYGKTIFIVYTDDTILLGPDKKEIDLLVKKLGEKFKIEDQGNLSDYLGIKIERKDDGTMIWTQPNLIKSVISDLGLVQKKGSKNIPTGRTTPACSTVKITNFEKDHDHDDKKFNYRQVIGKLLYLEKSTRPDISCAVHQCARFCSKPKAKHAEAVKRIGRYLLETQDKGLIMKPNKNGMECWVDASHASEWSNKASREDPNTARSRMGYIITYAGCPMYWASKMQTEIALSSTEAEYIALSQSMREVIPILWLLQEAKTHGIPVLADKPKVHCTVFEDNSGAIEIANVPKMRPRTKHLNIKYHHFREEVKKGTITIYHVGTQEQMADILTKALEVGLFQKLRKKLMGW